ncbi:hypothetical protein VaNZ11_010502 [Volvox africanus]|uniref:DUF4350 domain-containing protein n=1 Tax=Volvox africanus TaxID=51714 RepID=A0ABQ5S9I0_9CHLO|nr:hypothetical protein VaNZ11_010502 [Volvox africanus]
MDCKRGLRIANMALALGIFVAMFLPIGHAVSSIIPNVTIYMSPSNGVLDLTWDASPYNLERQLRDLGLYVTAAYDGQPSLTRDNIPNAYVIPYQNGDTFYVSAEDMREVTSYVASGGLVILLDAVTGDGAAARAFVSQALNLEGDWYLCKRASKPKVSNKRFVLSNLGDGVILSDWASAFLRGADPATAVSVSREAGAPWPRRLEDARFVNAHTLCLHEDAALITRPLYTVDADDMQVAAQAFGKVGVPGAVVWLGYSWKAGPQEQWGALINKIITDFAEHAYKVPTEEDAAWEPRDLGDQVVEEVASARGADLTDAVRLLLEGPGIYPPPPPPQLPPNNGHHNGDNNSNGNGNNNNGNGNNNNGNGNNNNGNGNNNNGNGNNNNGNGNNSNGNGQKPIEVPRFVRRLRAAFAP